MPRLSRLVALGAAAAAYSLYEPYRYRLEKKVLPVARPIEDLTLLHLSDMHMKAGDDRLTAFLRGLPEEMGLTPDVIVATGDLIEGDDGIDPLLEAIAGLEARLGRYYVLGSHDYFQATSASYSKYFTGERGSRSARRTDSDRLEAGLQDKGWISLINRSDHISTGSGTVRMAGVDDPYLGWHRTDHIHSERNEVLAIAAVHAPDVVSEWALNGFDLILAGHTHGGQVRIPAVGALVTNCALPAKLAAGLSRVGPAWLHVSRGLGTGRFAPVRFACTPEATLLTLIGSGTK